MENCEKQKDEIFNLAVKGQKCALYKGKVVACDDDMPCWDCDLGVSNDGDCRNCSIKFEEWCHKEYEESKIQEEVKNCKIDDKILVSDDGKTWRKRYFCRYIPRKSSVYVYKDGCTSWSTPDEYYCSEWEYAKLPNEKENE